MADMKLISKLFAMAPQTEPVKLPTVGHLGTDVPTQPSMLDMQTTFWQQPARRRFGSSGRIDAPPMSSGIMPTSVPMGRADFASMAMRDRAAQAMNAAVTSWRAQQARGGAGHQAWPMAIQI
jgi:hypothetical protein